MSQRLRNFIYALGITLLFALPALAVPGGPQAVIYYSDGLKLLKNKLYLTNGTLAQSLGSTASGGNVAFGGESAASASTSYPVLIERTLANAVLMQISNPSSDAAASAKIQLSTDAGDKLGELGIFPNEATTAAYSAAMTVRPNGNATRLSLIGGDLSTGHVAFYTAGDYAATGEALRVNADKSVQFMQQIATPATPASGSIKLYGKSDDALYALTDGGTELRVTPKAPTIQTFTSGSGTYTTPAGVLWIRVTMSGGGGGGGGSGTASQGTGGNGGNTTFGSSLLTANGGTGANIAVAPGGAGGTATINSPAIGTARTGSEGNGSGQNASSGASYVAGGAGGTNTLGGRGGGGTSNQAGQSPVANTGGGGGGGGSTNAATCDAGRGGGAGGYIEAIISAPSATYSYAVGGAGTAGSAGTNGNAGGAGAAGIIIVEEHYN